MWPILFILTLAAAIGIHFRWRHQFFRQQGQVQAEMEELQRRHQQTTVDAKAQQQVLFNSMLEGLLLLDRNRRIYLANRAFKNLFNLKTELRGKTIMEALRLHELATHHVDRLFNRGRLRAGDAFSNELLQALDFATIEAVMASEVCKTFRLAGAGVRCELGR